MIPDEAVEAAAAAVREGLIQNYVRFDDLARAALEAAAPHMLAGIIALADDWEKRGEYDMAYSKTMADEDAAIQILQSGAQMVDDARLIRNAIGA